MDEELKKLLEQLQQGQQQQQQAIATLVEANKGLTERLETQGAALKEASEGLVAIRGTVDNLPDPAKQQQQKSDTPPDMEALQAENAQLKTRLDALETQSTEDRTAREAAQASVAATTLRTALTAAAEAAGMQGTARDSFIEAHIGEFEQAEDGAIQVKGKQSPKDATKPFLVTERIEELRPTHPHYWPVPKGGEFDTVPNGHSTGLEELNGLEGQDLFTRLSQPLAIV